ncbi:hypothetical protein Tco_1256517 [Tanacetum coccineum]
MDNLNITMEEYIRLEEEKAHRRAIIIAIVGMQQVTSLVKVRPEFTILAKLALLSPNHYAFSFRSVIEVSPLDVIHILAKQNNAVVRIDEFTLY